MILKVFGVKSAVNTFIPVLILTAVILSGGCVQDSSTASANETLSTRQTPEQTAIRETVTEQISKELAELNSSGWSDLATRLGRPRATTLLWYHLKTTYDIDTKVVFGKPKKLDSAIAIMVSTVGDSPFPKKDIKGVEYYIIDPMVPAFVGDFDNGDMFDDPGNTYLSYSFFRLFPDDTEQVKQWMEETGMNIQYTDFPVD